MKAIYSNDLFTYNATYFQTLPREKWRSFANSKFFNTVDANSLPDRSVTGTNLRKYSSTEKPSPTKRAHRDICS